MSPNAKHQNQLWCQVYGTERSRKIWYPDSGTNQEPGRFLGLCETEVVVIGFFTGKNTILHAK